MRGFQFVPVLVVIAVGCVPWAQPPLEVAVGGGGSVLAGVDQPSGEPEPDTLQPAIALQMRSIPTTLSETEHPVDVGVGYVLEGTGSTFVHGPSVVGSWHLWRHYGAPGPSGQVPSRARGSGHFRLSVDGAIDWLPGGDVGSGIGARGGLRLDFLKWSAGRFNGKHLGLHRGEGGVGLFADINVRVLDDARYASLQAGVRFSLPALAGFFSF